ncbi:MAG: hypothetical protein EBV03_09070 [Proteobacteria bacterium]|nr:hypothetical protein [Pseudomonadota bacterium]
MGELVGKDTFSAVLDEIVTAHNAAPGTAHDYHSKVKERVGKALKTHFGANPTATVERAKIVQLLEDTHIISNVLSGSVLRPDASFGKIENYLAEQLAGKGKPVSELLAQRNTVLELATKGDSGKQRVLASAMRDRDKSLPKAFKIKKAGRDGMDAFHALEHSVTAEHAKPFRALEQGQQLERIRYLTSPHGVQELKDILAQHATHLPEHETRDVAKVAMTKLKATPHSAFTIDGATARIFAYEDGTLALLAKDGRKNMVVALERGKNCEHCLNHLRKNAAKLFLVDVAAFGHSATVGAAKPARKKLFRR